MPQESIFSQLYSIDSQNPSPAHRYERFPFSNNQFVLYKFKYDSTWAISRLYIYIYIYTYTFTYICFYV